MTLELREAKLYIEDITSDAWTHIMFERGNAGNPWEWYFGKTVHDGRLRVYYNPYNHADPQLVGYLDDLIKHYDLQCSPAAGILLESWRELCRKTEDYVDANREACILKNQLLRMQRFVDYGCALCPNFRKEQDGDDLLGFCVQDEDKQKLESSSVCMRYGEFSDDGIWHFGQKYYPHSGCKYLKIGGEKA